MDTDQTCPRCGRPTLEVVSAQQGVTAPDGVVLAYKDQLTACSACGEAFYTPDQSLEASRARAAALRAHAGLLTPAEIKELREKYGLSQADLEKALGFGAKTVVRWERGSVCQSSAANNLLVIAGDFPEVFADIARRNGVDVTAPTLSVSPRTVFERGIVLQFQCAATIERPLARRQKRYGRFRLLKRSSCEQSTSNAAEGCFEDHPHKPLKVGVA